MPSTPQNPQSRCWCITDFNVTPSRRDWYAILEFKYVAVSPVEICPSTRRAHRHIYIIMMRMYSFEQMQKQFGCDCHYEKALVVDAMNYVLKEAWPPNSDHIIVDNRKPGRRSDIHAFMDTVKGGVCAKRPLVEAHPLVMAKYPRFAQEYADDHAPLPPLEDLTLTQWQQSFLDKINSPVRAGKVHFYVDPVGHAGKTHMTKYLLHNYPGVQILKPAKINDMAYIYDQHICKIFVLDVPRGDHEKIQYGFLESVCDGLIISGKYESRTKYFVPPHVIVFMNEHPNREALTQERYVITEICKQY